MAVWVPFSTPVEKWTSLDQIGALQYHATCQSRIDEKISRIEQPQSGKNGSSNHKNQQQLMHSNIKQAPATNVHIEEETLTIQSKTQKELTCTWRKIQEQGKQINHTGYDKC